MRHEPGRQVVVTGASSGIGHGVAHAFAGRRADVVPAARRAEVLAEVARECRERGGRAPGRAEGCASAQATAAAVIPAPAIEDRPRGQGRCGSVARRNAGSPGAVRESASRVTLVSSNDQYPATAAASANGSR